MKHAYLIIAHDDYNLLSEQIRMLDYEKNDLYIHIDKKSSISIEDVKKVPINHSKLFCYKKYNVKWGTETQVMCELFLMESSSINGGYSYYHVLSGADLPIKSNREIYEFFDENKGKEFIHFDSREASKEAIQRVKYYHPINNLYKVTKLKMVHRFFFILDDLMVGFQKIVRIERKMPYAIIQKGCNWCSITDELVKYILNQKELVKRLAYKSECSDELFVQTLVMNSKFKEHLFYPSFDNDYYQCLRFIKWENNSRTPKILEEDDFQDMNFSEALFARKFSSLKSSRLIEMLKERIKQNE